MAVGVLKYSIDGGVTWIPMMGGPQGIPGQGVPAGGSAGQILVKDSATDYDTSWITYTVETFITSNLPLSWASGINAVNAGFVTNVSGMLTCLNGHFLAPANGNITLGIIPVEFRPQFTIYGTCIHQKIADGSKYPLIVSVDPSGNLRIWNDAGVETYQFYVNDTLSISITYFNV